MTAKHTAGPMTLDRQICGVIRLEVGGQFICQLEYPNTETLNSDENDETKANAKRLVTCWNNHDALVASLRRLSHLLEVPEVARVLVASGEENAAGVELLRQQARAALRAAGGEA